MSPKVNLTGASTRSQDTPTLTGDTICRHHQALETKNEHLHVGFLSDENGNLVFFPTPPLLVDPLERPSHSLDYILFKNKNSINKSKVGNYYQIFR
jgi:hypothetical protein